MYIKLLVLLKLWNKWVSTWRNWQSALLSKSLPEKGHKDKAEFTDSSISIGNIKEAADTSNIAAAISKGSCEDDSFCSEATEEEHHNRSDACNNETHINSLRYAQNIEENCHSGDDELGLDLSHDSPTGDIFKSNQNYSEIDEESNNLLDFITQEFRTPVKAKKKSVSQEQFNTPTYSSPQKFKTPVKDDASLQKQESCITPCRPTLSLVWRLIVLLVVLLFNVLIL